MDCCTPGSCQIVLSALSERPMTVRSCTQSCGVQRGPRGVHPRTWLSLHGSRSCPSVPCKSLISSQGISSTGPATRRDGWRLRIVRAYRKCPRGKPSLYIRPVHFNLPCYTYPVSRFSPLETTGTGSHPLSSTFQRIWDSPTGLPVFMIRRL